MASLPIARLTEEEYLRQERAAETKSEFVDGEMFAMSGGTRAHSTLAVRWITQLSIKLEGRSCSVYNSDLKVRTRRTGSYLYPDVSVVCGESLTHQDADDLVTNPVVVIEVLSPSTEGYDRGKKFALYREVESLQDYVLVHTGEIHLEQFTRQPGNWLYREYTGAESTIRIESIGCEISLGDLYTGERLSPGSL